MVNRIPSAGSASVRRSGLPRVGSRSMSSPAGTGMRPRSVAVLLAVAWAVVTVAGALVLQALAPSWSGTARALAVSIVLAVGVAVLLTFPGGWGPGGLQPARAWPPPRVLAPPAGAGGPPGGPPVRGRGPGPPAG